MTREIDKATGVNSRAGCLHPGCTAKGYYRNDYCIKHRAVFCVDCKRRFTPHILGTRRCPPCTKSQRNIARNNEEDALYE